MAPPGVVLARTGGEACEAHIAFATAARAAVEAHLGGCPSCRAALAAWAAVAGATMGAVGVEAALPPPAAAVVRAALTRAALSPSPTRLLPAHGGDVPVRRRGAGFAGQLLLAELRLVRPSVWLASLLVMACAAGLALAGGDSAGATVLSLVAPLLAVAGIAGVYGPRRDPAFEALASTVTSPRLVLLARVTLVFGFDLALVASALVLLGGGRQVALVALVIGWLGPMTLLSALSLLLAMWIGPELPAGLAVSLWLLRVLSISVPELGHGWLAASMRALWATSPGSVAATLALLAAAVTLSRYRGPPDGWYRPSAWRAGG